MPRSTSQLRRPLDPESWVLDVPQLSSPAVNPSGALVAYLVSDVERATLEPRSRIELATFDGRDRRRLTEGPRDAAPAWAPDGAAVGFLRRPDKDAKAQVYVIPPDGGEARAVTAIPQGVTSFAWAPDGSRLVCVVRIDPDERPQAPGDGDRPPGPRVLTGRIRYRGDGEGWHGNARLQLFLVDVETGKARRLTRGDHNHQRPVISPDGKTIAFISSDRSRRRLLREPMGTEICLLPLEGGRVRRLVTGLWSAGGLTWSPDSRRIAFVDEDRMETQGYVSVVDVRRGRVSRLTADDLEPAPGLNASNLHWLSESRILFPADARAASGLYTVTLDARVRPLRRRAEAITALSVSANGRRAAALAGTATTAPAVVGIELPSGRARQVAGAELGERHVARPERFAFRRNGHRIEGWLLKPLGFDASRRYPLVLNVHGGPHSAFMPALHPMQLLAGAGFLVAYVNPRGSTTYGARFAGAVNGDWGGEDYRDLQAAVDVLCRRAYVDEERLGIMGYSYGGYMSAWAVTQTPRFKAAIVGAPVIDIGTSFLIDDIGVALHDVEWGGDPWQREEWYRERSPITHARNVRTPVLLLHGEDDYRCPIADSEAFYTALRFHGKPAEFVRYPGASHSLPNAAHPALRIDYQRRIVDWFTRHLQPSRRRAAR